MRILLINPNTSAFITERMVNTARRIATAETEIVGVTGKFGATIVNGRSENVLAAAEAIRLTAEHLERIDGIILGISFDSGLFGLRELVRVPVVGMTEAALIAARLTGATFSMLTFGTRAPQIYRDMCQTYGAKDRLTSVRSLPMMTKREKEKPKLLLSRIVEEVDRAVEEDGCESIILSGAIFADIVDDVAENVSVPVLNGIRESVGLLEMMIRLRLKKAEIGSYAEPSGSSVAWPFESVSAMYQTKPNQLHEDLDVDGIK